LIKIFLYDCLYDGHVDCTTLDEDLSHKRDLIKNLKLAAQDKFSRPKELSNRKKGDIHEKSEGFLV